MLVTTKGGAAVPADGGEWAPNAPNAPNPPPADDANTGGDDDDDDEELYGSVSTTLSASAGEKASGSAPTASVSAVATTSAPVVRYACCVSVA